MSPKEYLLCKRLLGITEGPHTLNFAKHDIVISRGKAECGGEFVDVAYRGKIVAIVHITDDSKMILQRLLPPTTSTLMEILIAS